MPLNFSNTADAGRRRKVKNQEVILAKKVGHGASLQEEHNLSLAHDTARNVVYTVLCYRMHSLAVAVVQTTRLVLTTPVRNTVP